MLIELERKILKVILPDKAFNFSDNKLDKYHQKDGLYRSAYLAGISLMSLVAFQPPINDNTGGDIMIDTGENYPPCGDDLRYTHEFDLEDLLVWKHGGYLDLEHFWANQEGCVHAFDIVGRFDKVSIDTGDVTVDVP